MSACNRPGNMALRAALLSSVALVLVAGLSHPADAAVRKAAKTSEAAKKPNRGPTL